MNLLHKSAASRVLAKGTPMQGTIVGLHVWESGGGEDSPVILHEAYAVEADGRLFAVHQNLEPKSQVRLGMPVELRVDGDRAVIAWGRYQDAEGDAWSATLPNVAELARAADHEGGLGGCDDDAEFEFALDLIVEGLARRVA